MNERPGLTERQLIILESLDLLGPCDEGDVAYCIPLRPQEVHRVPPSFYDLPGEYIARRELKGLEALGLVKHNGLVWSLTPAGQSRIRV